MERLKINLSAENLNREENNSYSDWEEIELYETTDKSAPFVSIGRGQLMFNAVACQLIDDDGSYSFAKLLKRKEGKKTVIAVKFLKEYEDNSIKIKRKYQNGKAVQGITVASKKIIETIFGKDGANDGMVRHKVELVDKNILKIVD